MKDNSFFPDDESTKIFFDMIQKTEEERDEIIDTGAFNAYIAGYMLLTLKSLNYSEAEIQTALEQLQNEIIDFNPAKKARLIVENSQNNHPHNASPSMQKSNIYMFPSLEKEP